MSTVTLTGVADALIGPELPDSQYIITSGSAAVRDDRLFLIQLEQLNATYEYSPINSVSLKVYGSYYSASGRRFEEAYMRPILEAFNAANVTYNTRPSIAPENTSVIASFHSYGFKTLALQGDIRAAIKYGVCVDKRALFEDDADSYVSIYSVSSVSEDRWPKLIIDFGDGKNALLPTGTPQSGYVNPQNSILLRWSTEESSVYGSYTTPTQASAVVSYRETGSEDVTTISVTTAQQVTIAANTLDPGTSYEWKVSITDTGGSTNETPWYTISTTAGGGVPPKLQAPMNTAVDGSNAITFRWENRGGENNTGTDLEFSTDGETWGAPINLAVGVDSYTIQAGTLPSGQNYWRARAYNAESVAGDWTNPASFVVISSPQAPYYEVTNTPRPTISWVSDEQQAFQVQMGDYDSGLVFGTDQSFKCPVYLPNGSATVRVRVMNQYNLWSDWSGTQITIANTPGAASPVLTVTAGADAQLSWTDVGASRYLIYRDGELIGETDGLSFTDRYANGQASYFVRAAEALTTQAIALTDDYYINTNSPSGYVKIDSPTAAADTWSYAQVACVEGDRFLVTATGSNTYHLAYTFAKSDKSKVAPTATTNTGYTNEALTAPADAAWLVVNANMSNERSLKMIVHQAPDYYTDSNTVSVTIAVPCPMITAIDGNWIELQYSTEPIYTAQNTHTQQVSMMVYSGSVYPVPEIAPHRQRSYQIAVAFRRGESGPFEALLGRECFLKDQYGAAIHGVISAIATAHNRWYTVCSATLEEMEGSL